MTPGFSSAELTGDVIFLDSRTEGETEEVDCVPEQAYKKEEPIITARKMNHLLCS